MAIVKVVKTNAYYKRFQVKRRRRRQCKTDFQARTRLVKQDKNKYNAKKYRFVVRFSNQRVFCQVVYSTITGDVTVAAADSFDLKDYGIPSGLKNYAASYATGLLCARRLLKSMNLDTQFVGVTKANGEEFHIADEDCDRRPFRCVLDIGLVNSKIGHRCYAALKGAVDGGLDIPHSIKKFAGFDGETKEYSASDHARRIYGEHVGDYMTQMKEDSEETFKAHFAKYIAAGIDAGKIKQAYVSCHEKIRANPIKKKKTARDAKNVRSQTEVKTAAGNKYTRQLKLTLEQRKERVMKKLSDAQAKAIAAMEE